MSDISALIDVYRMDEISKNARAKIIIKLGTAINDSFSSNVTEPIVFELVTLLEPTNSILTEEHYLKYAGV